MAGTNSGPLFPTGGHQVSLQIDTGMLIHYQDTRGTITMWPDSCTEGAESARKKQVEQDKHG